SGPSIPYMISLQPSPLELAYSGYPTETCTPGGTAATTSARSSSKVVSIGTRRWFFGVSITFTTIFCGSCRRCLPTWPEMGRRVRDRAQRLLVDRERRPDRVLRGDLRLGHVVLREVVDGQRAADPAARRDRRGGEQHAREAVPQRPAQHPGVEALEPAQPALE